MAYDNAHLRLNREKIAETEIKTSHTIVQQVLVNGEMMDVTVPLYTHNDTHHYRKWDDVWEEVRMKIHIKELAEENAPALMALSKPEYCARCKRIH